MKINLAKFSLASSFVLALSALTAPSSHAQADESAEPQLLVLIDDVVPQLDLLVESQREDLLRTALYEASGSLKNAFKCKVVFDEPKDAADRDMLRLRVQNWERSPAGMFTCSVFATLQTAGSDGEPEKLGRFEGIGTSIAVINRRDVGEQFLEVAEDAFKQALKKAAAALGR